jgi:hypothetical protein
LCASTDDNNTPRLERFSVWEQELLATKVPTTTSTWIKLRTLKLDFGIWKNTSRSLS